jgi:hypothetical protein
MQNIYGTNAATWQQKLAADFPFIKKRTLRIDSFVVVAA